jgi:hypothetical protein
MFKSSEFENVKMGQKDNKTMKKRFEIKMNSGTYIELQLMTISGLSY